MAYSGSILAAILPQRYEKELIQRNNLAKIEKIQRNNSAISSWSELSSLPHSCIAIVTF